MPYGRPSCRSGAYGPRQLCWDRPANAGMLLGRVWEISPCGVRVQRVLADALVEEYFWAPAFEVEPGILQARCSPLVFPEYEALVSFQVAAGPGGSEDLARAKCVRAARTRTSKADAAPGGLQPSWTRPPASASRSKALEISQAAALIRRAHPPKCRTMISAMDAWTRPILQQDEQEVAFCCRSLCKSIQSEAANESGAFLCHLLLCCIAGVRICLQAQGWFAEHSGQASLSFSSFLQGQEAALLRLAATCLSRLDLGGRSVRRSIKHALRFCHDILTGLAHAGAVPDAWREMKQWIDQGLRRIRRRPAFLWPQRSKPPCTARGCLKKGRQVQLVEDALGPAGWRCQRHGQKRLCNVACCNRPRAWRVATDDFFGLAGDRCVTHGARSCEVHGCFRFARTRVYLPDEFGLPGRRCPLHCAECRCNVAGCHKLPKGRVAATDHFGKAGYRCAVHGLGCSVLGCPKVAWGRVQVTDNHGPAGRRCWIHGGKTCNIPGCLSRPLRRLADADHHGSAGIRCAKHSARCAGPRNRRPRASLKPKAEVLEVLAPTAGPQLADEARCAYSDGRSWRCRRPRKEGQRICEHHWAKRTQYDRDRRRKPRQLSTVSASLDRAKSWAPAGRFRGQAPCRHILHPCQALQRKPSQTLPQGNTHELL